MELGANDVLLAQNKLLTQQMSKLPQQLKEMHEIPNKSQQVMCYELCRGDHQTSYCPPPGEEVNYVSNPNQGYGGRQQPYQKNQGYKQGWRQDTRPSNSQNPYQGGYNQQPQGTKLSIEDTLSQFMQLSIVSQKSIDAGIKNLETQVGQLLKQLAYQHKGTFPANTQENPWKHCKSILTRSGRTIDMGIGEKDDARHYARFLDIFSRLQINIPFSEVLEQMPTYAKFMKDIITKKGRFTDQEVITVDACYSAIIQRTLPKKESDLGKVTLPVTINDVYVGKGLIDLGSSIILIPLSLVKKLGNIELKEKRITLQLADKFTTHPHGIAEDLLVKVDKFFFLVDFVVIDMEEDHDTLLIFGRPFMKTARMMIDIDDGLMKIRVQDEELCFNFFEAMKHSNDKNDCFRVDATYEAVMEVKKQIHVSTPLENALANALQILNGD
ncbi:uncharacterized protein LOC131650086 [Vicia villosa]|uniref:uncharacterized protein LOC131650086 n=1 Tax=Vicia villosa TaxID=3911 RepID=UPI00273CA087|nr:uncharacterized protein LOC131650086 [Vicia villosa]